MERQWDKVEFQEEARGPFPGTPHTTEEQIREIMRMTNKLEDEDEIMQRLRLPYLP